MSMIRPIGLDIEWKPNFQKGGTENRTSLMQLADGKNIVLVSKRSSVCVGLMVYT